MRAWLQALANDPAAAEDYKDYLESKIQAVQNRTDAASTAGELEAFRQLGGELAAYKGLKRYFVNSCREAIASAAYKERSA